MTAVQHLAGSSRRLASRPEWFFAGLAMLVAFLLFRPIVTFAVHQGVDYANHLVYLQLVLDGQQTVEWLAAQFPHLMFHGLVYSLYTVSAASALAESAYGVALAGVIYRALWLALGPPATMRAGASYAGLTLALLLVMPVNLFTPSNLYLGCIVIHAYHNPALVLLRPLAVLLFWVVSAALSGGAGHMPVGYCAGVTVLCLLAKSSYIIALALLLAYRGLRREPISWWVVMWGFGLPAGLTLTAQAALFGYTAGIVWAPLAVMNHWNGINPEAASGLVAKLLLSLLFPLVVSGLYPRAALRDARLILAWLTFAFGAGYGYLLAESGERLGHANFTWSGQVSLLILFLAALIFLLGHRCRDALSWRFIISMIALLAHTISGLHWYALHIQAAGRGDLIAQVW